MTKKLFEIKIKTDPMVTASTAVVLPFVKRLSLESIPSTQRSFHISCDNFQPREILKVREPPGAFQMSGSCMFTIAQPLNAMCGFQALAYNFSSWQKSKTANQINKMLIDP